MLGFGLLQVSGVYFPPICQSVQICFDLRGCFIAPFGTLIASGIRFAFWPNFLIYLIPAMFRTTVLQIGLASGICFRAGLPI